MGLYLIILHTMLLAFPLLSDHPPQDSTNLPTEEIELTAYVETNQVPLNRQVVFHVALSWVGDISRYKIDLIPLPEVTNLTLEGSGSSYRLEPLGDNRFRSVKTFFYKFRPIEKGTAYINSFGIQYQDTRNGQTDQLFSQRIKIEVLDPVAEPLSGKGFSRIYQFLIVLFLLTIAYYFYRYVKNRKKAIEKSSLDAQIPATRYLTLLEQEIDPKAGNLEESTRHLSKIFRDFLKEEFQLPTGNQTPGEICDYLRTQGVSVKQVERIEELFSQTEMVTFGGKQLSPEEFTHLFSIVENFLQERKEHWKAKQAK